MKFFGLPPENSSRIYISVSGFWRDIDGIAKTPAGNFWTSKLLSLLKVSDKSDIVLV